MTDEEKLRLRLATDFPGYAQACLFIRTKAGQVQPFQLNEAQLRVHQLLQEQKARTGQVRAIVLKARHQWEVRATGRDKLEGESRYRPADSRNENATFPLGRTPLGLECSSEASQIAKTLNLGAGQARTRSMLRIMRKMLLFLRSILRFRYEFGTSGISRYSDGDWRVSFLNWPSKFRKVPNPTRMAILVSDR